MPASRRPPLDQCYPTLAPSGPPPASLELHFVDSTGVELREELEVSSCPPQASPEPLNCLQPINKGSTIGGALSLGWQTMMGPPPGPPPGMRPPPGGMGPPMPYIRAQSSLYFPTIVTRVPPPPSDGLPFPLLPVFSLDTLRKPLEPPLFDSYLSERAHLMVLVHDCDGVPASDVEVTLSQDVQDARTVLFTINSDGTPVYNQDVSRPNGLVGYLNLPTEGRVDTTLTLRDAQSGGALFNGNPLTVMLQKGMLTLVVVHR